MMVVSEKEEMSSPEAEAEPFVASGKIEAPKAPLIVKDVSGP